ncbi:MAG: hypothetical protein DDT29_00776 [Dehalococcoidia bacterium]|nr:hypothetical protein [Bacillota bacterium]
MKVGLSEVVITPPVGTSLVGYFEDRKSTGIHDNLLAQTILFETRETMVALITCDLVALLPETILETRGLITKILPIPSDNIFIHTTHTHTGPATVSSFGAEKDEEYLKFLPELLSGSVQEAFHNLVPGRVGFGSGKEEGVSFNRRYRMKDGTVRTNPGGGDLWETIMDPHPSLPPTRGRNKVGGNPDIVKPVGPIDPEVGVIKIEDEDGRLRAILVNFACHLDTVTGNLISADYAGVLRQVIRKVKGDDVLVGFFCGTSGNINHVNFQTGNLKTGYFAHTRWLGTILAGEVLAVAEKIDCAPVSVLKSASANLEVLIRKPKPEELKLARKLKEVGPEGLTGEEKLEWERRNNLFGDEIAWARELILVVEEGKEKEKVPVGAFRLNDSAVAFLPGEVFVEFGLRIKSESRFKPTLVFQMVNSGLGYIPTREAFSQGTGYEERLARSSKLAPEAGDLITDTALKLLMQI